MSPENSVIRRSKHRRPVEIPPNIEIPYQEAVATIKARGSCLVSPFWALSLLGYRFTPEGRRIVAEKLQASSFAKDIGLRRSRGLRFPAGRLDSLEEAMKEIYLNPKIFHVQAAESTRTTQKLMQGTPRKVA